MSALSPRRKSTHFKARFGCVDGGIDATMARLANRRKELRILLGRRKVSLVDLRESSHSFPPSRTLKTLKTLKPSRIGSSRYIWGMGEGLVMERELPYSVLKLLVRAGTSEWINNGESRLTRLSHRRQGQLHFDTSGAGRRTCVDATAGRSFGPLWRLRPLAKAARTVERFPQPPRMEPTNS